MDEYNTERSQELRGVFQTRHNPGRSDKSKSKKPAFSSVFYAVAKEDIPIKRFKLKLRFGRTYSIPYSLMPIIILDSPQALHIKAYDFHIKIFGRNLESLEEHLSNERVLWMRENRSRHDDNTQEIFISDIHVEGKITKLNVLDNSTPQQNGEEAQ